MAAQMVRQRVMKGEDLGSSPRSNILCFLTYFFQIQCVAFPCIHHTPSTLQPWDPRCPDPAHQTCSPMVDLLEATILNHTQGVIGLWTWALQIQHAPPRLLTHFRPILFFLFIIFYLISLLFLIISKIIFSI